MLRNILSPLALLLFVIFCPSQHLSAQELFAEKEVVEVPVSPLIGNIDGRSSKSLNGTWNALIDPNKINLFNDLFHYAERNHKAEPGELLELSVENGATLQVPGDWNTQDERLIF